MLRYFKIIIEVARLVSVYKAAYDQTGRVLDILIPLFVDVNDTLVVGHEFDEL